MKNRLFTSIIILTVFTLSSCVKTTYDKTEINNNIILTEPSNGLLPFPWDLYSEQNSYTPSGINIKIPDNRSFDPILAYFGDITPELNTLTGFSINAPIFIKFSKSLEPKFIEKLNNEQSNLETSPILLVNITNDTLKFEKIEIKFDYSKNYLIITPFNTLSSNSLYAVILTKNIQSIDGSAISPDNYYKNIYNGNVNDNTLRVNKEIHKTEELLSKNFPTIKPVFILNFTTMDITTPMLSTKKEIEELVKNENYASEFTNNIVETIKDYDENTGIILKGKINLYDFRDNNKKLDYNYTTGLSYLHKKESVKYLIFYPKKGTEPFPVLLFQHGLSRNKELAYQVASQYNKKGIAVVAIDAVSHGERNSKPGDYLYFLETFYGITIHNDLVTIKPHVIGDSFRQTILNHIQMICFLKQLSNIDTYNIKNREMTPDGLKDFQTDTFTYHGQSMGSIMGTITSSLVPEIRATVLSVGGARISQIVAQHDFYKNFGKYIISYDKINTIEGERYLALFQTDIDPSDSASWGKYLFKEPFDKPQHVLMEMAYKDPSMPNMATAYLARAIGVPLLPPVLYNINGINKTDTFPEQGISLNIDGMITGGVSQFYDITINGNDVTADHDNLLYSDQGLYEATNFIKSYFNSLTETTTGKPVIYNPF